MPYFLYIVDSLLKDDGIIDEPSKSLFQSPIIFLILISLFLTLLVFVVLKTFNQVCSHEIQLTIFCYHIPLLS